MEALSAAELPAGPEWQYEPKWDGFRCLAFRDGDEIELQSKSGQPLARYFPDVVEAVGALGAKRWALDGELVIPVDGQLSFNDLQLRLHPAASRVAKLVAEHRAVYLVFDLLVDERGASLADQSLRERRRLLEAFAARWLQGDAVQLSRVTPDLSQARKLADEQGASVARQRRRRPEAFAARRLKSDGARLTPATSDLAQARQLADEQVKGDAVRLSPATADLAQARKWLRTMGGGLDGIVAKRLDALYESGRRSGAMQKIKDLRTADCVVGGFRYAAAGQVMGSLLLGLYGEDGMLHHVGFTSSLAAAERKALTKQLEALRQPPGFTGRSPGGPSRWSTERSGEFEPLRPELVVEVQYDHFTGGRFRHGTRLLRWRPEKDPRQCTLAQVEHESRSPLGLLR